MIKLGIFGDSYADPRTGELGDRSWIDFITDTGLYEIKNLSFTGSSLWYSYDQFLKNHHNFTKIIFLITATNRLTIPNNSNLKVWPHLNYQQSKVYYEISNNDQKNDYKIILDYYENIHDTDKDSIVHKLIIESISNIRPDAIIYPCFKLDYIEEFPLYYITKFEDSFINLTDNKRVELYKKGLRDSRTCHMIEDNNQIVSNMFLHRLRGDVFNITESILSKPKKDLSYYYQSIFFEPYEKLIRYTKA
jgi:hypothetical protein